MWTLFMVENAPVGSPFYYLKSPATLPFAANVTLIMIFIGFPLL